MKITNEELVLNTDFSASLKVTQATKWNLIYDYYKRAVCRYSVNIC